MLLFCDLLLLVPHHLSRRWLFCCCSRERLINIEIIQQIGGIFNQWPYYGNQFARSDYAIYLFSSPTSFKVRNWWKHSSVHFSVPIAFTSSVSRGDAHIPTHKYAHSSPHPPVSSLVHWWHWRRRSVVNIYHRAALLMSPSHISSVSDGDGHHLLTDQSALIRPPFSRPSFQSRSTNCLFMN